MLDANGNLTSLADTGYTRSDLVSFFNGLASKYGVTVEPGDVDQLAAQLMGYAGCIRQLGGDPQVCFDRFEGQYQRRGGTPTGVSSENLPSPTPVAQPVASTATTVAAPSASTPPTVGPTGLANPNAPINYATGAVGSQYGYGGVGGVGVMAQPATGGSNITIWLLLGAAALGIFFLMRK